LISTSYERHLKHQAHESQQHTQNCRGVLCFLEHLISRSLLGLYIASVGAKA
jgi:hypothetical protein